MQASDAPIASQPQVSRSIPRNEAVDFIKGFLVLGMILYHSINYFAPRFDWLLLYIKFISGGFIFISAYIVIIFYGQKWTANPTRISVRLLWRGLKLVVLFTVINLAINAVSVRNFNAVEFGLKQFANRADEIYLVGAGKYAAFEILLPIGYMLMLSPVILWLQRYRTVLFVALALVSACALFVRFSLNNFALLLVGGAGMFVAVVAPVGRSASRRHVFVSLPAMLLAVAALPWLRQSLAGYILYIIIIFKCVADISLLWPPHWPARGTILLLGEYVLWCYLSHILLLQVILRFVWPHRESSGLVVALIVVATACVLLLSVRAIGWARRRFQCLDRAYRFVFA